MTSSPGQEPDHVVCASMDAHILSNWLDGPTALRPPDVPLSLPEDVVQSLQPELSESDIARLLAAFDVDLVNGFIPTTDPLRCLPVDGKFGCWEQVMSELNMRLHVHNIRSAVLALPLVRVESSDLPSPAELRRAQLVLSMLAHAFVWGEEPVVSRIPACIAVPWVAVSHRLGRVPVLTHSAIILSNWRRLDPKAPLTLRNVGLLSGFYGGIDEAIFYLVTLEVEAVGAPALAHMLRAQHYARTCQWSKLAASLRTIASFLPQMTAALMLTYTDCDPYIFYTRVRSFLQGWRGNPRMPDGMIYEGVSEHPQLFHGGSAAQSCILAVFDAFLSVGHEREQTRQFMRDMRFYMPGSHRQFLHYIESNISVRSRIQQHCYALHDDSSGGLANGHRCNGLSGQAEPPHGAETHLTPPSPSARIVRDPELVSAFNSCVDELVTLRTRHIGIVSLYILTQANNAKQKIAPRPFTQLHQSPSASSLSLSASRSHSSQQLTAALNGSASASASLPSSSPQSPLSPLSGSLTMPLQSDDAAEGAGLATGERGTGGTSIMPYLKTSRDETRQVRL